METWSDSDLKNTSKTASQARSYGRIPAKKSGKATRDGFVVEEPSGPKVSQRAPQSSPGESGASNKGGKRLVEGDDAVVSVRNDRSRAGGCVKAGFQLKKVELDLAPTLPASTRHKERSRGSIRFVIDSRPCHRVTGIA